MQNLFRMEHPPKNTTGVLKLNPGEQNFSSPPQVPPPGHNHLYANIQRLIWYLLYC